MAGGKPAQRIEEKGAAALSDPVFVGRLAGFREDHSDAVLGMLSEGLPVGNGVLPVAADLQHLLQQYRRVCWDCQRSKDVWGWAWLRVLTTDFAGLLVVEERLPGPVDKHPLLRVCSLPIRSAVQKSLPLEFCVGRIALLVRVPPRRVPASG
jgi:hypothetical protein